MSGHSQNEDFVVEMKNICKNFGGVKALDHVNLQLRYGETLGLVGDNGAGKSTLMKVLSGYHPPDSGEILFENRPCQFFNPSDSMDVGIYMIYQKLALVDEFDIPSNIFLGKELIKSFCGGMIRKLDKKKMEQESEKILSPLKISIDLKAFRSRVRNLSGGQRASVAIGKVISNDAKVLIMDEPTAALGVKETRQFFEVIKQLKGRGLSVIFISHRMQDVFAMTDRVMILRGGKGVFCEDIAKTSIQEVVHYIVGGDLIDASDQ
ncbi:MAG: sugar ABC transporter ATP-binding protein [Desulfobacterales bacterium]|nr:MAG: sugar ABC transporter ATP-binding protein [Desulfobacterales bacterium]